MSMGEAVVSRLKAHLGEGNVLTADADLDRFVEDFRGRYRAPALCAVEPRTVEEVSAIMRLCAEFNVPVLPQGGNTSLCGGAIPAMNAIPPVIINLSRMRRIRRIDAVNGSMDVEAGCILETVQKAAADAARLYPVSLGAEGSCQIGGTLSTNAGGTSVLRYGNTRDNVLGLEVVLADGTIWNGLRGLRKDNTGLDLKQLFIGAEGTLGIITAATLKLHPLPTHHAMAWFAPVDPSAALRILGLFQASCASRLSAYELMNANQLDLVIKHVHDRRSPLAARHEWHVLVELSDTRQGGDMDDVLQQTLEQASEEGLILDAIVTSNDAQRAALWEVRHSVTEANKKAGMGLTTDCAVPISAVPEFIEHATAAVHDIAPQSQMVIVGHMGDGNIHLVPMFTFDEWAKIPDPSAMADAVRHCVNEVANRLEGTFSAEHGIGQTGLPEMAHYKSAAAVSMMRAIKQALDPRNLLNPGRVIP